MPQLPHGIRQGLRVRYAPPDYERIEGCVVRLSEPEKQIALDILREQLAPSDPAHVAKCLAGVDAATAARDKAPVDEQARRVILVSALKDIPPDLIAKACRSWVETQVFRPTAAEIRALCHREWMERKAMLDALVNPKADEAREERQQEPVEERRALAERLMHRLRNGLDIKTGEPLKPVADGSPEGETNPADGMRPRAGERLTA